MLDTNAVIAILNDRPAAVRHSLRAAIDAKASISVPSIVLFELWYGVYRSAQQNANAERLSLFLTGVDTLPFDDEDAQLAAQLRSELAALGTPIGPYDTLIAAQALAREATLVTANRDEFARVRALKLVDWTR